MKVIEVNIGEIIPYDNNPRKNDNAIEKVAKSIKEFGFKVPIVLDSDNVVVTGHTRLKAAKLLNLDKVPCIMATDLTPEQVKAYRLADNKTAEIAGWDFAMLEQEMNEILNINMEDFGFMDGTTEIMHLDDVFGDVEDQPKKAQEEKQIQCPHCKLWFHED